MTDLAYELSDTALFLNFLPTPLALLTEKDGSQNVHIAPEAFQVASAEFPDQIDVWQSALPGALKGQLASVRHNFLVPPCIVFGALTGS